MIAIIEDIKHKILAQQTTQYFINGAPGSGKSYALTQLAQQFPEYLPGFVIFGPFAVDLNHPEVYSRWIIDQLYNACYLDETLTTSEIVQSVAATWDWLTDQIQSHKKRFVILLDVSSSDHASSTLLADFFSALRSLEFTNFKRDFGLHHILTGYWDHLSLEDHYQGTNVSFPYTVGHNYKNWSGLSANEVLSLVPAESLYRELYANILYEITGGHASIIMEILSELSPQFRLMDLLNTLNRLSQSGRATDHLVNAWKHLPASAITLLTDLLLHRNIPLYVNALQHEHYLIASGIAMVKKIGQQNYLCFKSWYTELVIRQHYADLNIEDKRLTELQISDISPEIQTINTEAFRIIRDIEISARNLVIIALSRHRDDQKELLEGFDVRYENNALPDLAERAKTQLNRSNKNGLNTSINPLIAYITTGELANLISEIGRKYRLPNWDNISKAMQEVSAIRNAVMHNQLIDETSLNKLYSLQSKIYAAFPQTS